MSLSGPLVTIVIPVYNTALYLRECLDSVFGQTYSPLEVIVVNDGSTDGSRGILEEYPQIRIVDQENKGLGAARNAGLDVATGRYVYFLDSDDKITPDAIESLSTLAEAQALDQIVFEAEPFADDSSIDAEAVAQERRYHTIHPSLVGSVMSGPEFLTKALPCDLPVSQPVRFFRRDFLVKHGLRYPEGILHEDTAFSWISTCLSARICAMDRRLFLRRVRGGSIMRTKENLRRRADGCLQNIRMVIAFAPFWTTTLELRQGVLRYCLGPLITKTLTLGDSERGLAAPSDKPRRFSWLKWRR